MIRIAPKVGAVPASVKGIIIYYAQALVLSLNTSTIRLLKLLIQVIKYSEV